MMNAFLLDLEGIRAALRARAHPEELGRLAKDIGVGVGALDAFANGRAQLGRDALCAYPGR